MKKLDENIELKERKIRLENEDNKEDSMRYMTWFSLIGMLLYPFLIILCGIIGLESIVLHLASIAEIYFLSVSGIVSVYFGSNAYSKKFSRPRKDLENFDE